MNKQWNHLALTFVSLLAAASLTSTAFAANSMAADEVDGQPVQMSTAHEVPTGLSNEPRIGEEDGTCSTCIVDYLLLDDDDAATATLDLYFADNGEDELTDILIRVLLVDGQYRALTVPSVELIDGQLHEFELMSGPDWDWGEARYAWVEVQ